MPFNDYLGEPVLNGTWLYDGVRPELITILARDFDMRHSLYEAEGWLEQGERPIPPGPDGRLYYVADSPPLPTLQDAKQWADRQPWGPVTWDE